MKRFILEYANYKIKDIKNNSLMREDIKIEAIAKIERVLKLEKIGFMTVDEAIKSILNCFTN